MNLGLRFRASKNLFNSTIPAGSFTTDNSKVLVLVMFVYLGFRGCSLRRLFCVLFILLACLALWSLVDGEFFLLCWGLTARQPVWVVLCRLLEKGVREIEEIVGEMKEKNRVERRKRMKEKKQKKKIPPSTLTVCNNCRLCPTVSQYQFCFSLVKFVLSFEVCLHCLGWLYSVIVAFLEYLLLLFISWHVPTN